MRLREVPYIPQMNATDCGAATLAMILSFHGCHVDLAEIRSALGGSRDGSSFLSVKRTADAYGLTTSGVRVDLDALSQLSLPALIHWDFNHYVVLESTNRKYFTLVDPALGRRKVTYAEMGRHFTGVALTLVPNKTFKRRKSNNLGVERYTEILTRRWRNILQILCASLSLQLLSLLFPVATQVLLDRVIGGQQKQWLFGAALILLCVTLTRASLTFVRGYILQSFQHETDSILLIHFVTHLLDLPFSFFLVREPGDLTQRVESNVAIRNLLSTELTSLLLDALLVISYIGLMALYSLSLTLILLTLATLRVCLLVALRRKKKLLTGLELSEVGREHATVVEALTGLETTRASGAGAALLARWEYRAIRRTNASLRRRSLDLTAQQIMVAVQGITTAIVVVVGGTSVLAHSITFGMFGSILAIQYLFMVPLESSLQSVDKLQEVFVHLHRLNDILMVSPEHSGTIDPGNLDGSIGLTDVCFRHGSQGPAVLNGINLFINSGETIAIVGRSGAGKSTLAKLLVGLYIPSSGAISFNGHDLRLLDARKVRSQIGIVTQESFLFDASVRSNLELFSGVTDRTNLMRAARIACVDDVVLSLPNTFDSFVGENGTSLSGGERQRLTLARAIVHRPAILLLDEATSALNIEIEQQIYENLKEIAATKIIITHRLEQLIAADRILVVDGGQIVQTGTFSRLQKQGGLFNELLTRSAGGDLQR